ncbi:MAG: hypothetical protein ABI336_08915 [Humibacillus sp.]
MQATIAVGHHSRAAITPFTATVQSQGVSSTTWTPPGLGNPITFMTVASCSGGLGRLSLDPLVTGFPAGTTLSRSVSAQSYGTSSGTIFIS